MGVISLESLLPKHLTRPDDASPIAAVGVPHKGFVTRIGFDRKPGDPISFEGETKVHFRFCPRLWQYRLRNDGEEKGQSAVNLSSHRTKIYETDRWRLEIGIEVQKAGPMKPPHMAVVAQVPYGSGWVQAAALKMYSKKKLLPDEAQSKIPILESEQNVEEQLESAYTYDIWETNRRYVAGISFPDGYRGIVNIHPRNTAIDFVMGACPDFIGLRDELMASDEIQNLLKMTQREAISFWMRGKIHGRPKLHDSTKAAATALMMLSVEQSLAGPAKDVKKWIGKPVWKLADYRYRNHLNNVNRIEDRRPDDQSSEDHDTQAS